MSIEDEIADVRERILQAVEGTRGDVARFALYRVACLLLEGYVKEIVWTTQPFLEEEDDRG